MHRIHRFGEACGKTQDFSLDHIRFLTVEQALADYARLITSSVLHTTNSESVVLVAPVLNMSRRDFPSGIVSAAWPRFLTASRQRKVVAFGGSYGGMLSSWMRAKCL